MDDRKTHCVANRPLLAPMLIALLGVSVGLVGCKDLDKMIDMGASYSVRDCWWQGEIDADGDRYGCQGTLSVEIDQTGVTKDVCVRFFRKRSNETQWILLSENRGTLHAEGDDPVSLADAGSVPTHGLYDFRILIEVTREGEIKWRKTLEPADDADLRKQKLESASDDLIPEP